MPKNSRHKIVITINLDLDEYVEPVDDGGLIDSIKADVVDAIQDHLPCQVISIKIL